MKVTWSGTRAELQRRTCPGKAPPRCIHHGGGWDNGFPTLPSIHLRPETANIKVIVPNLTTQNGNPIKMAASRFSYSATDT